jgi:hypothetical protein
MNRDADSHIPALRVPAKFEKKIATNGNICSGKRLGAHL